MRGHSGYGTAGVVTGGVASVVIAVLNLSGCAAYVTSIVAYVRVGVLNASGVCTNVTGSIAVVIVLVFGCSCVGTVLVVTACVAIIVKTCSVHSELQAVRTRRASTKTRMDKNLIFISFSLFSCLYLK